jgi:multiple sugar transport system substrate-binding protein
MKKLSLLLAVMMLAILALPCLASAEENITLTYALWDDYEFNQALADAYHELHPNVTIQILQLGGTADYMANLYNMMAAGTFPDMYQLLAIDAAVTYGWMLDLTSFCENDPEWVADVPESIKGASRIEGKVFQLAVEHLPITIYLDQTVFEKENVPMPSEDWTWEDMIGLIETMARPDQGIWSYNSFLGLLSLGPTSLVEGAIGEFGWDGQNYHFDVWADCITQEAEYRRLGYRAIQSSPEWAAVAGSNDVWPGNSGFVAMQLDAWWTYNNIYSLSDTIARGIKMVPYNQPISKDVKNGATMSFIDFAAINRTTAHPQEAYDALKYMSFSKDGWLKKCELYKTLPNAAGDGLFYAHPNVIPATVNPEVWAAYRALYDDSWWWDGFFANCMNPVPLGARNIPGFDAFLAEIYNGLDYNGVTGIENAVFQGVADPYDYVDMLNQKGREYYDSYMKTFKDIYGM